MVIGNDIKAPVGWTIRPASTSEIHSIWVKWGLPIVSVDRAYMPEEVEGLVLCISGGEVLGLVTWAIDGNKAEIVTLDAFRKGYGGRLLDAAEKKLEGAGVQNVSIVTTNDNLNALDFYIKRGYRLVKIHLDAMDKVFAMKPDQSRTGLNGDSLRDMWELRKGIAAEVEDNS